MDQLEQNTGEPSHKRTGRYAYQEGIQGADAEQCAGESAGCCQYLIKAGCAKDKSQPQPCFGANNHGTDGHGDHHQGNGKPQCTEVSQRCEGHDNQDCCHQTDTGQLANRHLAFGMHSAASGFHYTIRSRNHFRFHGFVYNCFTHIYLLLSFSFL